MDFDNLNLDFAFEEDFGLAKSISKAPLGTMCPQSLSNVQLMSENGESEIEKACKEAMEPFGVKAEGFNFKLGAAQDQVQF